LVTQILELFTRHKVRKKNTGSSQIEEGACKSAFFVLE